MNKNHKINFLILIIFVVVSILIIIGNKSFFVNNTLVLPQNFWVYTIIITTCLAMGVQSTFTLVSMLYAWENPNKVHLFKSPTDYLTPKLSFTALLPARNEKNVIAETVRAIALIDYPEELKEIIVLCRNDDQETIDEVIKTIGLLNKKNIRLLTFSDYPINKPHSLNIGLNNAQNQVVTIFDAEDQPHKDIYKIVNTVMGRENIDVVQSGVQLMNFRSRWFSSINVLEYFFWFKSGLSFLSSVGNVTPLGGNTVFFKKEYLKKVNGWDENCLTEDADIGIRLVKAGAKIKVIYDERHVTKEETPDSVKSFIKQRTRWNHGFLQILLKGDWKKLPETRQKFTALYTLLTPMIQFFFVLYIPIEIWVAINYKANTAIAMFSFLPTYLLFLQMATLFIGIREFAQTYNFKYSIFDSLKILIMFFPYQLMLAISSVRAVVHLLYKEVSWEKTNHVNAHRISPAQVPAYVYAKENI